MKTRIIVFVAAAVFIILGAAANSFAQPEVRITGTYGDADVKDANVVKAARFAVGTAGRKQKATITLVSLNKAQMQVVAGLNYKVCLTVRVKKARQKAVRKNVQAVVYRNLRNELSLTRWTTLPDPDDCP